MCDSYSMFSLWSDIQVYNLNSLSRTMYVQAENSHKFDWLVSVNLYKNIDCPREFLQFCNQMEMV